MKPLDNQGISHEIANVRPIRDIVYEYLRNAILDGDLLPGERIVERTFAEQFGASRTPVREAIRKLEMENLLEYIPRKGVVIKGIDLKDIVEIYSIRQALETLAFKTAIPNLSEDDLSNLQKIVKETEESSLADDVASVIKSLEKFDEIMMKAGKMPRLQGFIVTLQESIRRFRKMNLVDESRRKEAIGEHKEILEAVKNRDIEKTEQLVKAHIERACRQLIHTYGKMQKSLPRE
ncbi:MAG: GntR family transcriptional regulator [Sporomusaceae bacterium]|nr:GntR family transcriptional regulator [Sporomusaceae bacterium]